ncbi:multicomponent Na+:H+ antiporter subunit D [Alkalibacterium subtropicum]|uniref:Multicomponent Na+:H+ antiporter subunit D n=1 Tax=Alkalibacterium subtropicum TaxID=753702 RepID=A0A1I1JT33_9LACT|nr:proton-conducting transporter membrane subunit [Alkalibacterium subtropicum]SFC51734.1 multicomponent Na+:H+ antiporter subunit D [Alkalibacterium subtropicum]
MLYWLVLIPIVIAIINIMYFDRDSRRIILAVQLGMGVYATDLFRRVANGGTLIDHLGGYDRAIAITLYGDRIAIVLVWLTTLLFFGLLLYAYNKTYFTSEFGFLYLSLQSLIIGLFLSTDLFNIYVLIEVSTVIIALLIMLRKDKQAIYDGMIFLFVSVIGSGFWLLGTGFLYKTFGTLDIYALEDAMARVNDPRTMIIPFAFILTTISLKIALFPLSSWLPIAYGTPSAPSVIPAILSGVYETTGLYLFIRLTMMFRPAIDLSPLFLVIGFATSILGFVFAVAQEDLRVLLAYSTISQVGLIVVGLALGTEESYWGSIFHMFAHSLFKTVLFLAVGTINSHYQSRMMRDIKGGLKELPVTGWAIIFGLLGITGAPLFNGSISKYMISYGSDSPYVQVLLNVINFGTILYSIKFASILSGPTTLSEAKQKAGLKKDWAQWVTFAFGILTLLTGLLGNQVIEILYGYSFDISLTSYLEKAGIYVLLAVAAWAIYKGWIKEAHVVSRIRGIELTFNAMITALVGFFIALAAYMAVII